MPVIGIVIEKIVLREVIKNCDVSLFGLMVLEVRK